MGDEDKNGQTKTARKAPAAKKRPARPSRAAAPRWTPPDWSLIEAVEKGPEAVERALAEGVGERAALDTKHGEGTAFLRAAAKRCARSVELLLPLSDPRARDGRQRDAMFLAMLDVSRKPGEKETADIEAAKIFDLVAPYFDPQSQHELGYTPLMVAVSGNLPRCFAKLLAVSDLSQANCNGETVLMMAAKADRPDFLLALLERGAATGVDDKGRDALIGAAECGTLETVKILLGRGFSFTAKNAQGEDALQVAMDRATVQTGIVRELLAAWAKTPDGQKRSQEAFWHAASRGKPEILRELIQWADVNARDETGASALDLAAAHGKPSEHIELLLAAGADAEAKNPEGQTALELMAERGAWICLSDDKEEARNWAQIGAKLAVAGSEETACKALARALANSSKKSGLFGFDLLADALRGALAHMEARKLREALAKSAADCSRGHNEALAPSQTKAAAPRKPRAL
jgi:ankyrin repeat protein